MKPHFDPTLYLVTDAKICGGRSLVDLVEKAVSGGVTLVQLREKVAGPAETVEIARKLLALLKPHAIPLIINDSVEIAKIVGAQGVHLGQGDIKPAEARNFLGSAAVIGLSLETHTDISQLAWDEIDYVAASPVFATPTKADISVPFGVAGLRILSAQCRKPLVAIGGINLENLGGVLEAGAEGIAVVSAILGHADPGEASRVLLAQITEFRRRKYAVG